MDKSDFFNVLDFGSSEIRFSVFDFERNEKFSESKRVDLNMNFQNHFDEINKIIKNAEKKNSYHVEDIILILDSSRLLTIEVSLCKSVDRNLKIIKIYDSLVQELKQLINTNYYNYHVAHIIVDRYIVSNKENFTKISEDKTLTNDLKVDFKILCFPKKFIKEIKENFIRYNLNIINICCSSYTKSQFYVNNLSQDKASFLEIGWERSSFLFYEKKKLKFIYTIPIGGFHITKDISKIFKIPEEDAEKLKKFFNKTETEFSYDNKKSENSTLFQDIIKKNISIDLLKKVILHRVQEIIDLIFKKSKINNREHILEDTELFLIGEGSRLFNSNSFYLNDRFGFKSINYYSETDVQICNSSLENYVSNFELPEINNKKQGLFEKFFNFFDK